MGVWTINGYIFPPELWEARKENLRAPEETIDSDVDDDDGPLDHAPAWSNGRQADEKQGLRASALPQVNAGGPNEECKLVLVVRTDLGMTKGIFPSYSSCGVQVLTVWATGKIAAQCSHATLACFKALSRAAPGSAESQILRRWEKYGQAKIALQIKSEDEVLELRRKARNAGVTAEVIHDAGRTQIESGSLTVLGVGPAPKSQVDQITGHLKLL